MAPAPREKRSTTAQHHYFVYVCLLILKPVYKKIGKKCRKTGTWSDGRERVKKKRNRFLNILPLFVGIHGDAVANSNHSIVLVNPTPDDDDVA